MPRICLQNRQRIGPLNQPEYFNFTIDIVDRWAKDNPHHVAMLWLSQDMTSHCSMAFQYFSNQPQRVAFMLTKLGIKQGGVLTVLLPRIPAWLVNTEKNIIDDIGDDKKNQVGACTRDSLTWHHSRSSTYYDNGKRYSVSR